MTHCPFAFVTGLSELSYDEGRVSSVAMPQYWVTSYLRIGVVGKRPRRSSVKSYYLLRPKAKTKTKASYHSGFN